MDETVNPFTLRAFVCRGDWAHRYTAAPFTFYACIQPTEYGRDGGRWRLASTAYHRRHCHDTYHGKMFTEYSEETVFI
jgi:hypothetical protein